MSSDEMTAANDARRWTQAPAHSARKQYRLEPHESLASDIVPPTR